jgi:hypothetical protein
MKPNTSTHAHCEPLRKAAQPTKATPRPVNADGTETKATVPSRIGGGSPIIGGGSPIIARPKAPTPAQGERDFVPIGEIDGIKSLRPGDVERLQGHGIYLGLVNGLLCIRRLYVPSAQGIIQQARGQ